MSRRVAMVLGAVVAVFAAGFAALNLFDSGNPTTVEAPTPVAPAPSSSEASAGDAVAAGQGADQFPTIATEDLNGTAITLPGDLPGDQTVVLVSWGRDDQAGVDGWKSALATIEVEVAGVDHVQLAVTPGTDATTRTAVTFFMGRAIPDTEGRARTIPVFTDPDALASFFGLTQATGVSVLVVVDGAITWRHTGGVDAQSATLLRDALQS